MPSHPHHPGGTWRWRTRPAAAAAGRADESASACEGARTPALLAAAQPLPISERQREVAALAAAQLSNRKITAQFGVQVRTEKGHIYDACRRMAYVTTSATTR